MVVVVGRGVVGFGVDKGVASEGLAGRSGFGGKSADILTVAWIPSPVKSQLKLYLCN